MSMSSLCTKDLSRLIMEVQVQDEVKPRHCLFELGVTASDIANKTDKIKR